MPTANECLGARASLLADHVGPVRGPLTWLPINPEERTLMFLRRAIQKLRYRRGADANDKIFPSKAHDSTCGYEAFAKCVRAARRVFLFPDRPTRSDFISFASSCK